jgi:hypothetical protein
MKKRFALILGGPHAGTTRLFRRLGTHPQVVGCRVSEPRFFSDDRKWALGLDWYRTLWDFREPDERIAIEASNEYARHPLVPCPAARVAQTPAGFRFVWLLREPVARIAAWHAARVADGLAEPASHVRELDCELAASRYANQLAAWRQHFPAQDFLLLCFEEWLRSPEAVLEQICRFLEIDPAQALPDPDSGPRAQAVQGRRSRGVGRWLAARRGDGLELHGAAPPGLPAGVEEALEQELAGERDRLADEWGFAPALWRSGGKG